VYLGEEFADDNPMRDFYAAPQGAGSVIAVVATDAPFFPSQCKSLARRVALGLARTGTIGSHSSGDIFLAVSTANEGAFSRKPPKPPTPPTPRKALKQPETPEPETDHPAYGRLEFIPWDAIDPFYEAVVQATEEAVANALIANEDMTGRDGHRSPALPRRRLAEILSGTREAGTREA
jgi:D-aminopeptidase